MQRPVRSVYLRPLAPRLTQSLWARVTDDDERPVEFRDAHWFAQWLSQRLSSEALGFGAIRAVFLKHELTGFVTFSTVDSQYCPSLRRVVECGTYLLPEWRGKGIHPEVKRLTVAHAFEALGADWVCFAIPEDNGRALRAFAKLGWQYEETQVGCTNDMKRYTERKTWEMGRPCRLFWIRRQSILGRPLSNLDNGLV